MKKYARILLLVEIRRFKFPVYSVFFVVAALFLLIAQPAKAQSNNQTKIDVDFKNVPLKQALDFLQKKSTYNFVYSEEIDRKSVV